MKKITAKCVYMFLTKRKIGRFSLVIVLRGTAKKCKGLQTRPLVVNN